MIGLDRVSVRNFISWGDYDTTISLADRGQCFLAGEVEEHEANISRSNGAGKSSLTQAILWCLSGKTMYKKNPGDGILNRFTDNDCRVSLQFKGGATLTRVRRRDGDTELLYSRGQEPVIDSTLSTTSNQQDQLDKELGFDFDIFCGSVFFNQFSNPWMEMGDQTRKQTMERIMGIDRLSIYAEVAKKKRDRVEKEQIKLKAETKGFQLVMDSFNEQITATKRLSEKFGQNRALRAQKKSDEATRLLQQADQFEPIDTGKLAEQWTIVETIKARIRAMRGKSRQLEERATDLEEKHRQAQEALDQQVAELEEKFGALEDANGEKYAQLHQAAEDEHNTAVRAIQDKQTTAKGIIEGARSSVEELTESIELWRSKEGQICSECEQEVPESHTASKIEPKLQKNTELLGRIAENQRRLTQFKRSLEQQGTIHAERVAKLDEQLDAENGQVKSRCSEAILAAQEEVSLDDVKEEAEEARRQRRELDDKIDSAEIRLTKATPTKTVREAEAENTKQDLFLQQARKAREEAAAIEEEPNPHLDTIADLDGKVASKQTELGKLLKTVEKYDFVYKHLHYIYRAYSERRKIKSFLISRHRPFFNSRLGHYLDSFDLDVKIQLTDSLGLESNLWGYDYQSGGERARTNLAYLFSVFDLHTGIHGPQCNVLVLDEPDHHLDEAGRAALIEIINNDLACRFETILIISHNTAFRDVFPSQLTVRRVDRLSYLDESR